MATIILILLSVILIRSYGTCTYNFTKRIALVTGGAQGNGHAIISELLLNGIQGVTMVDTNVEKGMRTMQALNNKFGQGRVIFLPTDVSDSDQFEEAFRTSVYHWKGLDIVVNNAGVVNENSWKLPVNVNIRGTIYGTLLGFKYLSKSAKAKGGIIVNISSVLGIDPMIYVPVYCSTKSFVLGLSRALDNSIYYNHSEVRVITICPGPVDTELLSNFGIAASNSLNPRIKEITNDATRGVKTQSPDAVGKGVIYAIQEENSGSVWVIEDYEYHDVVFPDGKSMKKKKTLQPST